MPPKNTSAACLCGPCHEPAGSEDAGGAQTPAGSHEAGLRSLLRAGLREPFDAQHYQTALALLPDDVRNDADRRTITTVARVLDHNLQQQLTSYLSTSQPPPPHDAPVPHPPVGIISSGIVPALLTRASKLAATQPPHASAAVTVPLARAIVALVAPPIHHHLLNQARRQTPGSTASQLSAWQPIYRLLSGRALTAALLDPRLLSQPTRGVLPDATTCFYYHGCNALLLASSINLLHAALDQPAAPPCDLTPLPPGLLADIMASLLQHHPLVAPPPLTDLEANITAPPAPVALLATARIEPPIAPTASLLARALHATNGALCTTLLARPATLKTLAAALPAPAGARTAQWQPGTAEATFRLQVEAVDALCQWAPTVAGAEGLELLAQQLGPAYERAVYGVLASCPRASLTGLLQDCLGAIRRLVACCSGRRIFLGPRFLPDWLAAAHSWREHPAVLEDLLLLLRALVSPKFQVLLLRGDDLRGDDLRDDDLPAESAPAGGAEVVGRILTEMRSPASLKWLDSLLELLPIMEPRLREFLVVDIMGQVLSTAATTLPRRTLDLVLQAARVPAHGQPSLMGPDACAGTLGPLPELELDPDTVAVRALRTLLAYHGRMYTDRGKRLPDSAARLVGEWLDAYAADPANPDAPLKRANPARATEEFLDCFRWAVSAGILPFQLLDSRRCFLRITYLLPNLAPPAKTRAMVRACEALCIVSDVMRRHLASQQPWPVRRLPQMQALFGAVARPAVLRFLLEHITRIYPEVQHRHALRASVRDVDVVYPMQVLAEAAFHWIDDDTADDQRLDAHAALLQCGAVWSCMTGMVREGMAGQVPVPKLLVAYLAMEGSVDEVKPLVQRAMQLVGGHIAMRAVEAWGPDIFLYEHRVVSAFRQMGKQGLLPLVEGPWCKGAQHSSGTSAGAGGDQDSGEGKLAASALALQAPGQPGNAASCYTSAPESQATAQPGDAANAAVWQASGQPGDAASAAVSQASGQPGEAASAAVSQASGPPGGAASAAVSQASGQPGDAASAAVSQASGQPGDAASAAVSQASGQPGDAASAAVSQATGQPGEGAGADGAGHTGGADDAGGVGGAGSAGGAGGAGGEGDTTGGCAGGAGGAGGAGAVGTDAMAGSAAAADGWAAAKECNVCRKRPEATFICGSCRGARYCSVECQRADWKGHKAVCRQRRAAQAAACSSHAAAAAAAEVT